MGLTVGSSSAQGFREVLVTGGVDESGDAVAEAEIFDPAANNWSATGSNGSARYLHTATPLLDGRVLVVGGAPDGQTLGRQHCSLNVPTTGTRSRLLSTKSPQNGGPPEGGPHDCLFVKVYSSGERKRTVWPSG